MDVHPNTVAPLSVVVMTYNEEINLERCLESVSGWASRIFVVDSFSTDGTLEIARRYTPFIEQHAYESHPHQWNWALSTLDFAHEWILALDADFVVTPELRRAITDTLQRDDGKTKGYYVRHRQIFRGRFIRHGTIYPRYWLRLFRREAVFIDQEDLVDLHFYVRGPTKKLEFDVIEDNWKERDLSFWIQKQVRFAQRQGAEEIRRRQLTDSAPVPPSLFGTPDQRTLWLKSRWYFLPLYWRSLLYFLYRYVLRLGFLDGRQGFLYHFTQALLYRLMVDARIEELRATGVTAAEAHDYAAALNAPPPTRD